MNAPPESHERMVEEFAFRCPLPNGLHARPASLLSEAATRCVGSVMLTNLRSGAAANAKSVLALIAIDVREGDDCRLACEGPEALEALGRLRTFIERVLPRREEMLSSPAVAAGTALPRLLRDQGGRIRRGTIICTGIAEGVVVFTGGVAWPSDRDLAAGASSGEEEREARAAIAVVRDRLASRLEAAGSNAEAGVLRAHLAIARDVGLQDEISAGVGNGLSAARAIRDATASFAERLRKTGSRYVQERAVDVEDVGFELLAAAGIATQRNDRIELSGPSIVAGDDLTPRQLLSLDRGRLAGLVLAHASPTSHAMILARSFGIPTLTDVTDLRAPLVPGDQVLVDATLGILIPEITPGVRRHYDRARMQAARRREVLARCASRTAVTRDGARLEVAANVASPEEIGPAIARGADGIGLFRTEMLFLDRDAAPDEEEQVEIYARAIREGPGKPILVRTFDIGGDKPVPYLPGAREANPFLGYRGARLYPEHAPLLRIQVRAILRAAATAGRSPGAEVGASSKPGGSSGPRGLSILLPMITTVEEVRFVRNEIAAVRGELASAGIDHDSDVPVGVMIEVPSAALLIDRLAREVDFFSIGTNDLLQYFLAADRSSERVSHLYRTRHPAFLRLLERIVGEAHRHDRWVGLCGEMAGDPGELPLLLGLGLDEISVAAPGILALKNAVSESSSAACRSLLERAMEASTLAEVDALVERHHRDGESRSLFDPDLVIHASAARSREEAIAEIVDALHAAGRTDRPDEVEEAIVAREAAYSTGFGHGFAIPHCKTDAVLAGSIAILRLEDPIAWGLEDAEPVRCVILLAARATGERGSQMQVFSKLARNLMREEFRGRILAAADGEDLLACLTRELAVESSGS